MIETLKRIHVSTFQQNKAHMIEKLKNIHVSTFQVKCGSPAMMLFQRIVSSSHVLCCPM